MGGVDPFDPWQERLNAIRSRLLRPDRLTLDERARLEFELREIERLVSDLSRRTRV
jgi:hypothetical protein